MGLMVTSLAFARAQEGPTQPGGRRNVLQHAAVTIRRASLVVLLALLLAPACVGPRDVDGAASTPALARRLVRGQGGLLLDVRSIEEFESGHIEGAKLVPYDEVGARIGEIASWLDGDRSKPIVVSCRSGKRAKLAKRTLERAGFTQVVNLGGMSSWCEDC
jgi:rhodanese-related sulfurtransferase